MMDRHAVDRALVQWGDRLFFPANRIVKPDPPPRLHGTGSDHAGAIRRRIAALVAGRPQAVIKARRIGRGMKALSDHFSYVSRKGTLDIEDDRGVLHTGKEGLSDLAFQWRHAGALIDNTSSRLEALAMILSAPAGSDPHALRGAVREFARTELHEHRYVMALHVDTGHPHVHLTVRLRSRTGRCLEDWAERDRWRSVFAEKLRDVGIDVEATRQSTRGENRLHPDLWQVRQSRAGTSAGMASTTKPGRLNVKSRVEAMKDWSQLMKTLAASELAEDRVLAERAASFVRASSFFIEVAAPAARMTQQKRDLEATVGRSARTRHDGPELTR